jgi:hypothetical protein
MSKARLERFLDKLSKELSNDKNAEDFRSTIANKRVHSFTYDRSKIVETLENLLTSSVLSGNMKESAEELIYSLVKNTEHKRYIEFNKALDVLGKSLRTSFKAREDAVKDNSVKILKTSEGNDYLEVLVIEYQYAGGKTRNNFGLIKTAYSKALNTFYAKFLKILGQDIVIQKKVKPTEKNPSGLVNQTTSGDVFHLEHKGDTSNIVEFINSSIHKALKEEYNTSNIKRAKAQRSKLEADLQSLGLELRIEKNLKTNEISVFLGDERANSKAAGKEGALRKRQLAALTRAITKLGITKTVELQGSDSIASKTRKKTIKGVTDPFKNLKNIDVKVTTESLDIVGELTSASLRIKPGKVSKGSKRSSKIKKRAVRKNNRSGGSKSIGSSPLALIQMLNAKLPAQVAQNMESPALNYRTGRFASSVRVVDAAFTAQNFLSFGYTYMKYPYQTFEPGYAQGSTERDPRRLIDRSMREIAAEFAIGRFYTRRM